MSKADLVRLSGLITEILPNAMFKVQLENNHMVTAYLGGKLRKNEINITTGDSVELELSPYDLTRGRVVYRQRHHG